MARPLRLEYPGALYHITSRGNAGQKIFRNDKDRIYFLELLGAITDRLHWLCHAYCLMDNHYHLVIETPEGNLSRGMRQVNGMYTQRYNWKYKKTGHVFQGRYKAIIVDKDSYLLELCRYVVLNPVRAHMVEKPEEWKWSSYGATAGTDECAPFLTTDWLLSQFSQKKKKAQALYQQFVLEGLTRESPWKELKGQIFLGDKTFIESVKSSDLGDVREIPRAQRNADRPELGTLFTGTTMDRSVRNQTIDTAHVVHGYTLKEIGDHTGLHYTTVSRIIRDQQRALQRKGPDR